MPKYSFKVIHILFILMLALVLPATTITWAESKTNLSPAAKAGQKVFQENCTMCHFANQAKKKIGPGMKGILKNKELPYSHKAATVANTSMRAVHARRYFPVPVIRSRLCHSDTPHCCHNPCIASGRDDRRRVFRELTASGDWYRGCSTLGELMLVPLRPALCCDWRTGEGEGSRTACLREPMFEF